MRGKQCIEPYRPYISEKCAFVIPVMVRQVSTLAVKPEWQKTLEIPSETRERLLRATPNEQARWSALADAVLGREGASHEPRSEPGSAPPDHRREERGPQRQNRHRRETHRDDGSAICTGHSRLRNRCNDVK